MLLPSIFSPGLSFLASNEELSIMGMAGAGGEILGGQNAYETEKSGSQWKPEHKSDL